MSDTQGSDGLFQTKNPKTGKPYPAWRFHYIDRHGRQRTGTGDTSKQRTRELKKQVQARERAIRRKWIEEPKESAVPRKFTDVKAEYLTYGNSKGGLGGRPWGTRHAQKRAYYLKFWGEKLKLVQLSDLLDCHSAVERELSKIQAQNKAGKTLQNYADGLAAFCGWCVKMEYLDRNPLEKLSRYNTTPRTTRRALTLEEIRKFLASIDEKGTKYAKARRLGYEVAVASGLRKKEIRSLIVADLDVGAGGIHLHAEWTKNRKAGFQHLQPDLVKRLEESARGKQPTDPLVFVSRHASEALTKDLVRAGLKKVTLEGKVDFHALRVAYTTLALELGTDLKTVQTLTRHSTAEMMLMTYGRSRNDRLASTAQALGDAIFNQPRTKEVQQEIEEAEMVGVSLESNQSSTDIEVAEGEGE